VENSTNLWYRTSAQLTLKFLKMSKFQQAKDLYKLQKQAKDVKKKLANIHIEAEEEGVKITINGEQEILSVEISDEAMQNKATLEESILKCMKKGLKKSQEVAAVNMKEIMDQMGLNMPGMGGDQAA
jgi:DNA-binding protein YbaB